MPPRARAAAEIEGSTECMRLCQLAEQQRVCSRQQSLSGREAELPRVFTASDGKDISKKSSSRKGRYLLHIAAHFQPVVGGLMGTLANLDSKHPVLYFDFPAGRLKLIGTLTFPKAKYLLLKFGAKDVLCEDVFESVVLFADMHWVGTKEMNPSEEPLDLPEALQADIERVNASRELQTTAGSQAGLLPARRKRSPTGEPSSQLPSQPPSATKRRKVAAVVEDVSSEEDDDEVSARWLSQRQHLGRSAKTTAQRKLHEAGSDLELASNDASGGSTSSSGRR